MKESTIAETGNRTRYLRITSAPLCLVSYLGDTARIYQLEAVRIKRVVGENSVDGEN